MMAAVPAMTAGQRNGSTGTGQELIRESVRTTAGLLPIAAQRRTSSIMSSTNRPSTWHFVLSETLAHIELRFR